MAGLQSEAFMGCIMHFAMYHHNALMHHTTSRVYQNCTASMMLECNTGELLTRTAFMQHDDKGKSALNQCEGFKVLRFKGLYCQVTTARVDYGMI